MVNERIHEPAKDPFGAPPLLFVHGACHGAWCWGDHFLRYFADQGYDAHAFSLRGHGGDNRGWRLRFFTEGQYLEDLQREVDRFKRAPILIGHSIGARLVQRHAARHGAPAVVLLTPPPPTGLHRSALRLFYRVPEAMVPNHLLLTWSFLSKFRWYARYAFFRGDLPDAELDRHMARLGDEAAVAYGQMLFPIPRRDRRITCPALVLAAEADAIFTTAEVRATAHAVGGRYVEFPDMAHDVMLDRDWRQAAEVILAWLAERGFGRRVTRA